MTYWSITKQKLINIVLVALKLFKVVKFTTSPMTFDKPDIYRLHGKSSRSHPLNFCGGSIMTLEKALEKEQHVRKLHAC